METIAGTKLRVNDWRLQFGADFLINDGQNGDLYGGLKLHYSDISARLTGQSRGSVDTDRYTIGATLTWYGHNGFYVDNQLQGYWQQSDLSSDMVQGALAKDVGGYGGAASVEIGDRIPLGDTWRLVPQAQLIYSYSAIDDYTDSFGVRNSTDSVDSLRARLGLALENSSRSFDSQGRRLIGYGIANLHYEFLDQGSMRADNASFDIGDGRWWGGIGVGSTYEWANGKYGLFGEITANTDLSNFGGAYDARGVIGLRWQM